MFLSVCTVISVVNRGYRIRNIYKNIRMVKSIGSRGKDLNCIRGGNFLELSYSPFLWKSSLMLKLESMPPHVLQH